MTDQPTPTDDDLSLALDGEADAELLARIEADPAASARLAELRAAADQVASATVAPLDPSVVDDLIASAIDTPIAPVGAGTRGPRRATPWLVAASVVLLMAVGLTLVWAGRSSDEDQASASFDTSAQSSAESSGGSSGSGGADSSFTEKSPTPASEAADQAGTDPVAGGHGTPTTVQSTSGPSLPVLYLGSYDSGDALREATAASLADAWKASGSQLSYADTDDGSSTRAGSGAAAPSQKSVDRCGEQLRITLNTEAGPVQTGYATVDDDLVLVYEFAAASARDGKDTTLVAAVGIDACDEVVIFER